MSESMEVVPNESAKDTVLNNTELLRQVFEHLDLNDILKCRLGKWPVNSKMREFESSKCVNSYAPF